MYDQKRKEREFWLEIAKEALESHIEHLSNSIIYKLLLAFNGEDFTKIDEADFSSVNPTFIESLLSQGLTEYDIQELKKAGIDISSISIVDHEIE